MVAHMAGDRDKQLDLSEPRDEPRPVGPRYDLAAGEALISGACCWIDEAQCLRESQSATTRAVWL
jgi:hypothetical protein